jgi:hypothetical protein
MKPFLIIAAMCFLAMAPALRAQSQPPEDQYFDIYSLILKGDRLMEKGKSAPAMTNYLEAQKELKRFQEDFPLWNIPVVKYRLGYLDSKLSPPEPTPAAPAAATRTRSMSTAPDVTAAPVEAPKAADDGQPVEMTVKWQTGKRYEMEMDMTMDSTINVSGQKNPMAQKMKMHEEYAFSVLKDRDGGGKEVEMEITGIGMNMEMGGKSLFAFDSKTPPDAATKANPGTAAMQKMVGAHLKLLTDAQGRVEKVVDLDEFVNSIGGGGGAAGASMVKSMMSEDTIKQMAMHGLPDHSVKIGDSWPIKLGVASPELGGMVVDLTYTFTGWEQRDNHKCAVLAFAGDIYTQAGADGASPPGFTLDDGKSSGQTLFDPVLGMATEGSAIQSFSVKMNTQGKAITDRMTQDINTKLTGVTDISQ